MDMEKVEKVYIEASRRYLDDPEVKKKVDANTSVLHGQALKNPTN